MRDINDQMNEIRRRKGIYQELRELKKKMLIEGAFSLVFISLMAVVAGLLPGISNTPGQVNVQQYGSMRLEIPTIGYVLVAFLAFAMGILVTLISQQWKKKKEIEKEI